MCLQTLTSCWWAALVLAPFLQLDNVPLGSQLGLKEVLFFRIIAKHSLPGHKPLDEANYSFDKPVYMAT